MLPAYRGIERHCVIGGLPIDDNALLNHATTGLELERVPFSTRLIFLRFARLARNSANIQHAPMADKL